MGLRYEYLIFKDTVFDICERYLKKIWLFDKDMGIYLSIVLFALIFWFALIRKGYGTAIVTIWVTSIGKGYCMDTVTASLRLR